jgi:hypothetical protein
VRNSLSVSTIQPGGMINVNLIFTIDNKLKLPGEFVLFYGNGKAATTFTVQKR